MRVFADGETEQGPYYERGAFTSVQPVFGLNEWFEEKESKKKTDINHYDPQQAENDCYLPFFSRFPFTYFMDCGTLRSKHMQIDHPQVIDRSINKLLVDSSRATMDPGQQMNYLVTNEVHTMDPFWQSAFLWMVSMGLVALAFGALRKGKVSHAADGKSNLRRRAATKKIRRKQGKVSCLQKGCQFAKAKRAKIEAGAAAAGVAYNMFDDSKFIIGAQQDDPVILYCSVVSIIIVPITMFINVMFMPNRTFERISGKPPTKEKRFLYFVAEYFNATVFFTDSNELITERLK